MHHQTSILISIPALSDPLSLTALNYPVIINIVSTILYYTVHSSMPIHILQHPLGKVYLSVLRDKSTDPGTFR
jgi:hypothetical protein